MKDFKDISNYPVVKNKLLKPVFSTAKKLITENNLKNVEPSIYYMNCIDTTPFDWKVNKRTCEFYVFYDKKLTGSNTGALKIYVTSKGNIEGFLYKKPNYLLAHSAIPIKPIRYSYNPQKLVDYLSSNLDYWFRNAKVANI